MAESDADIPSTARELRECASELGRAEFLDRFPEPWLVALDQIHGTLAAFRTLEEHGSDDPTPSDSRVRSDAPVWLLRKRVSTFPDKVMVGRASNNDLVILQASMSKLHAFFGDVDGQVRLTDANSKNGTFLNSEQLTPMEAHTVDDHDVVRFGATLRAMLLRPEALWEVIGAGLLG